MCSQLGRGSTRSPPHRARTRRSVISGPKEPHPHDVGGVALGDGAPPGQVVGGQALAALVGHGLGLVHPAQPLVDPAVGQALHLLQPGLIMGDPGRGEAHRGVAEGLADVELAGGERRQPRVGSQLQELLVERLPVLVERGGVEHEVGAGVEVDVEPEVGQGAPGDPEMGHVDVGAEPGGDVHVGEPQRRVADPRVDQPVDLRPGVGRQPPRRVLGLTPVRLQVVGAGIAGQLEARLELGHDLAGDRPQPVERRGGVGRTGIIENVLDALQRLAHGFSGDLGS